jgi:hypothetical protein
MHAIQPEQVQIRKNLLIRAPMRSFQSKWGTTHWVPHSGSTQVCVPFFPSAYCSRQVVKQAGK